MGFWSVYMGIYGGGETVTSPAYETTRHKLYGTALTRHALHATATTRHSLHATALTRHKLKGSTPR